jgi:Tfp pilus assembly protein PilZ
MTGIDPKENRRKYPRFNAPICYRSASLFSARKPLVNISLGGIRIYSDEKFKIGKRLEIELLLPDDMVLQCTMKVVWQSPLPEGSKATYDTGLQFLDVPADGLHHLTEVLEQSDPGDKSMRKQY